MKSRGGDIMIIDSFDIECPYCNKEISISMDTVGDTVSCPFCKKDFNTKDNGILSAVEDAENDISDMLSNLL
jgi:transcription elongation factor Elf1